MSIPKNGICPLCKVPLREYHDYVTCPSCETSYHEKCWQNNNGCPICDIIEEPVSASPPASVFWYLFQNNRNLGPLSWEELCHKPDIQPDDLVWNREMPNWVRADRIPDLPLMKEAEEIEEPDPEMAPPEAKEPFPEETAPAEEPVPEKETEKEEDLFAPKPDGGEEPELEAAAPEVETAPLPESIPLEPVSEPLTEKSELEEAPPEAEELFPEEIAPAEEPVPETRTAEPLAGPAEAEPLHLSRTEQLIEQIYADQGVEQGDSSAAKMENPAERAKATLIHARQVIAGIMLVLGGAIAAATTYFYAPVSGTIYYLIAVGAIVFGVAGFFRGLSGWLKLKPWHTGD